jgi:hypothetical protein
VSNQFATWIDGQIKTKFRTRTALAEAMEMQLPALTRGIDVGTFSIVNLLKLAKVTDTNPSVVLRLANKPDVADLIEELYQITTPTPAPLPRDERRLLARWRALSPQTRHSLEVILVDLPPRKEKPATTHRRRTAVNG